MHQVKKFFNKPDKAKNQNRNAKFQESSSKKTRFAFKNIT